MVEVKDKGSLRFEASLFYAALELRTQLGRLAFKLPGKYLGEWGTLSSSITCSSMSIWPLPGK
jgi:hypothetical protein